MHDHVAAIAGWCGAPGSIAALLFLTGLAGGFAHCGPMCSPFVLAQVTAREPAGAVLRRLAGGLLLPYHLGRLTTYAGLGAAVAGLGAAVTALPFFRLGLVALLLGAALLFLAQAVVTLPGLFPKTWTLPLAAGWAGWLARASRPLLDNPGLAGRFALGTVLGLLPCGFLYAALAAAAATQDPWRGAAAMAAFALGTVPSQVLVGCGAASLTAHWRGLARRVIAPLFLFNAAVLTAIALGVATSP
jgi:sulfite exporter TauE/SafE